MNSDERTALLGQIMAEYGVKIDPHDPAIMIVDLCTRVLDTRIAQVNAKASSSAANGQELAEAVTTAYTQYVLPRMQAVIATEVKKVLDTVTKPTIWTHPAFVGVTAALGGVIVGFLLRAVA